MDSADVSTKMIANFKNEKQQVLNNSGKQNILNILHRDAKLSMTTESLDTQIKKYPETPWEI